MIGHVSIGKSAYHCISYCLEDKRELTEEQKAKLSAKEKLQHQNRAEVLFYNQCFGNKKELASQFRDVQKLCRRCEKPVLHLSLRLAPGENLSKAQLSEMGRTAAEEFGVGDHQYICVLHKDTKEQHIHIAANRVGFDGKAAKDGNSYKRMSALCRRLEKQYGLHEVLSPRAFLPPSERGIARHDSRKEKLKSNIRNSLEKSQSYPEFEKQMKSLGSNAGNAAQFYAGGSCGNVITILSYLGWNAYPIARLSNNPASSLLIEDLQKWHVKEDLLTFTDDGSTPVIIHRILKDSSGAPKHRFEFRNPEDGTYLPSYKPCLSKAVPSIVETGIIPHVFYFDRINRASINLAKEYKAKGAIVFFEPSSMKDLKGFEECLAIADVVKFSQDRIASYEDSYDTGQCFLEIQTLGNDGLKFRTKNGSEWLNLSGYTIDNVIDSAGAGDWCSAGIIINLFSAGVQLQSLSIEDIGTALQFGQALSALNCTFEGARGLMYNIGRNDLILSIQHILDSHLKKIPQHSRPLLTYHNPNKEVKISSLFATA